MSTKISGKAATGTRAEARLTVDPGAIAGQSFTNTRANVKIKTAIPRIEAEEFRLKELPLDFYLREEPDQWEYREAPPEFWLRELKR